MDPWIRVFLPFALLLGRISAFLGVLPIFSWTSVPRRVRAALALLLTAFLAGITPRPALGPVAAATAGVMLVQEILCGLAMGLAARLVYSAVQQAGRYIGREMGLAMAEIVDPTTGERDQPIGTFFDLVFALFFLTTGLHHLLIRAIVQSYSAFPAGSVPSVGALTQGVVEAGSAMLLFALKLAAPIMAAFLILSVVLGILARVLPEMDILMTSFPLRIALGLFMAAAVMPVLDSFAFDLATWMNRLLMS